MSEAKMNLNELEALEPSQLVELLGCADWNTREAASAILATRGEASVEALVSGLSHSDWQLRAACASLMDHLADDRCAEPLVRALHDRSPHVRRLAIHSIGCQRCKAAPLQLDIVGLLAQTALSDPSIRVRRVAVHQLGLQAHDPRAVEALQTILDKEVDNKLLSRTQFALSKQLAQIPE